MYTDISAAVVRAGAPQTIKGIKYIDQLAEGKTRAEKVTTQEADEIRFDKVRLRSIF